MIFFENEIQFLCNFNSDEFCRDLDDRKYRYKLVSDSYYIEKLLKWFEKETNEKLKNYNYDLIIHTFNEGDFFSKHVDSMKINNKNRAYVVGIFLNDDYIGGDFILYNPKKILPKVKGTPYYFKSDRMHEITMVKKGVRKSGLIFIHHEDLEKHNLI
jgi:Rps23 Pro-64 3,4-dihydroxylase Tpa1-like proline 4-hydroxylase